MAPVKPNNPKTKKHPVDTPKEGSWYKTMDVFKDELQKKADEYRDLHGSNIIPSGAVYLSRAANKRP